MATAQLGAVLQHIRNLAACQKNRDETDGALLRAFLSRNDQPAFETLVQRHGPMVLRVCLRTLGRVHDAEDALQATFLVLARQAASIRKRESLASWLHGVAYRMATHAKRADARRRGHEARATQTSPQDPALTAAWQEFQALLDEELEGLPETLREPFVLCCLENRSCAEAAHQLNLQEGTVRTRLSRVRRLLQERLTRRGVSLAAVLAAAAVGANGAPAAMSRFVLGSTVKAAAQVAAGRGIAGGFVSARVITLVEGVNQTMFLSKCKTMLLLLALTGLASAGFGLAARGSPETELLPPAQKEPQDAAHDKSKKERSQPAEAEAKDVVKVRGRVLDPDGKAVGGAAVAFVRESAAGGSPAIPARTTAGPDGKFLLTVGRGDVARGGAVVASAKGYGPAWKGAETLAAGDELSLRLAEDDVPIRGKILDPEGRPLRGASVRLVALKAPSSANLKAFTEALGAKKEISVRGCAVKACPVCPSRLSPTPKDGSR